MNLSDIIHPWPPGIHRYEQKFFGIPVISFMAGGFVGVLGFVIASQAIGGVGGMILGALTALLFFGMALLCTTKLAAFYGYVLPIYLLKRWQAARDTQPLQLPLIVSAEQGAQVEILNFDGEQQSLIG